MQLGKPRGEMCPFKNSIFTQVDQRDEEHASRRRQTPELPDQMARGLIIGDGQQTKPRWWCVLVPACTQGEVHFWHVEWTHIGPCHLANKHHTVCRISFYSIRKQERLRVVFFSPHLFGTLGGGGLNGSCLFKFSAITFSIFPGRPSDCT